MSIQSMMILRSIYVKTLINVSKTVASRVFAKSIIGKSQKFGKLRSQNLLIPILPRLRIGKNVTYLFLLVS